MPHGTKELRTKNYLLLYYSPFLNCKFKKREMTATRKAAKITEGRRELLTNNRSHNRTSEILQMMFKKVKKNVTT